MSEVEKEDRNNCDGICEICPDCYTCPDSPEASDEPEEYQDEDGLWVQA